MKLEFITQCTHIQIPSQHISYLPLQYEHEYAQGTSIQIEHAISTVIEQMHIRTPHFCKYSVYENQWEDMDSQ